MNKIDTVAKLSDLTRTFGTLCWNLSKVIPYKDMPLIYPCFIPQTSQPENLEEFSTHRDMIVKKVRPHCFLLPYFYQIANYPPDIKLSGQARGHAYYRVQKIHGEANGTCKSHLCRESRRMYSFSSFLLL